MTIFCAILYGLNFYIAVLTVSRYMTALPRDVLGFGYRTILMVVERKSDCRVEQTRANEQKQKHIVNFRNSRISVLMYYAPFSFKGPRL